VMIRPVCLTLLAALAVQGCATKPATTAAENLTDPMNDGRATTCNATPVANGAATITMSNDGWCSIALSDGSGPFQYALLKARPANGRIMQNAVGSETRVEYTPNARFSGTDQFTVAFKSRTASGPDVPVQVAVTVGAGEASTVSAPAAVTAPRPAATPARRPAARPSTPARRNTTR
jgi:Bacterial Ig domain